MKIVAVISMIGKLKIIKTMKKILFVLSCVTIENGATKSISYKYKE